MTLNQWQERLEAHFAQLREDRWKRGANNHIFALEHGMSAEEFAELKDQLHEFVNPADRHYLAWAVYAAEVGYQFSGDEYWSTYSRLTPKWTDSNSNRDFIRDSFRSFQRKFNGVEPQGPWAKQFTIICWPITHAILPRDLQLQLARVLYGIRGLFTPELLRSPELLGEQIEIHSWDGSSRFHDLCCERLLIGQLATGLLLAQENEEESLILPSTLRRIATDLDLNQRSREWLKSAQSRASSVRLRGLHRSASFRAEDDFDATGDEPQSEKRRTMIDIGIEPDIILRRVDANTWNVRLELPDFSPLLLKFPHFRDTFTTQRCLISGTRGRILARGFLLHGSQEILLTSWPEPGQILLKFELSLPELEYLLTTECLLRPGPNWVFKVSSDGTATEIRTRTIQAGCSYIVVSSAAAPVSEIGLSKGERINVACSGIAAFRFDTPESLSQLYSEELVKMGFHAGSSLQVKPVGVPAAKWDDEGSAEWLSSDSPMIAITSDFEINGLALNLEGPMQAKVEVSGDDLKSPVLATLGPLDSGRYRLHVIASRPSSAAPLLHAILGITIREPREWKPTHSTPFEVLVSPSNPRLEELWDGRAKVEIHGPRGRTAVCELFFYREGNTPLQTRRLPPLKLPCSDDQFQNALESARCDRKVQNAYDECVTCVVHIQCDELGRYKTICERQPTALRWVLKHENHGYFLRLIQLDNSSAVSIEHYTFEKPDLHTAVLEDCISGLRVALDGGLYVARASNQVSAIVVPPLSIRSFTEFEIKPALTRRTATDNDICGLLAVLELWANSRNSGNPLSYSRRQKITVRMKAQLIALLCEDSLENTDRSQKEQLKSIARRNETSAKVYAEISRALTNVDGGAAYLSTEDVCSRIAGLSDRFLQVQATGHMSRSWFFAFAYKLINEPELIRHWAGKDFGWALGQIRRNVMVLRICRFAGLLRTLGPIAEAKGAGN